MTANEIHELVLKQKKYFNSGETLSIKFRLEQLKKLYNAIKKYENEINEALYKDLGKSSYEGFMCESGLALTEITYMLKNLKKLTKIKKVKTPLAQFHSKSFKKPIPYGNVLIMSPWNYPFLLTIEPLVDCIAAGNTAILKPSAYSMNTSIIIEKIIKECFSPEYVYVVKGGRLENSFLLDEKFDFIFFTGSQTVGKEVLRHAADNLCPVVLELGGKSPCIVDKTANIKLAAKRIVFGKYLNCGQTCVAPDYILCENSIKDEFIKEVIKEVELQYGKNPLNNRDYGRIINEKHFSRLCSLIDSGKVVLGGNHNIETLQIEPTVMDNVNYNDLIMQEEIFGPIMPIIEFNDFDSIISDLKNRAKPLALYIFSSNKKNINRIIDEVSYGGGCINDCIIHLATSEMGFGGVGESGMGSYHGKDGFDAFSHYKSIVDKKEWIDLPMRYQPYNNKFFKKLLHKFLK